VGLISTAGICRPERRVTLSVTAASGVSAAFRSTAVGKAKTVESASIQRPESSVVEAGVTLQTYSVATSKVFLITHVDQLSNQPWAILESYGTSRS